MTAPHHTALVESNLGGGTFIMPTATDKSVGGLEAGNNLDATIVIAHSEKEQAAPTWKNDVLLSVLGVRSTGSPPIMSGTAP